MAELIPFEYRVGIARKRCIRVWTVGTVLAAIVAGAGLASAYSWQQQQLNDFAKLDQEYRNKSVLIKQATDLQAKRLDLAARMQKMQSLRDDKTLLSLLQSVSSGFSEQDSLQYINIVAHPAAKSPHDKSSDGGNYSVRLMGITKDYTSHAKLLDRLTDIGMKSQPPLSLPPDSTQIQKVKDGEVIQFEILCEQPKNKGA